LIFILFLTDVFQFVIVVLKTQVINKVAKRKLKQLRRFYLLHVSKS